MSNADTVRRIYDAFAQGDVGTVLGAMDDKVDWRGPASLPYRDQVGPQAVAEHVFGPIIGAVEGFRVEPSEIVDAGDVVVGIGTYRGTGKGGALDAGFTHVWRFGADGKVTAHDTYTDTHLWRQALGID